MRRISFSYRGKVTYIIIGLVIGLASLVFTRYMAEKIEEKETNEIEVWARGFAMVDNFVPRSVIENELLLMIIQPPTNIPVIVTDDYLRILTCQNVDSTVVSNPKRLRKLLEKMSNEREPIRFSNQSGIPLTFYYSESVLLKSVHIFPYAQLGLIAVLISFAFITFRSSKQNEQNRVWVGMAKETAHQLGTPTSSLLGWIDYLKSQEVMPEVTEEMSKDVARLMKVADRFGKIGSSTLLAPRNVHEVVANTVNYFRVRIPKNVVLTFEESSAEPVQAMINDSLFEWVIENLLKNALDALQGKGEVKVEITHKDKWVYVDVKDTGKGMSKGMYGRIFRPGFSTKTRGWGLGLSLSRRIVEEYHKGRIFVKESEIGRGTTFRIMINKV